MIIASSNWTYRNPEQPPTKSTCSCGSPLAKGSHTYCVRHAEEAHDPLICQSLNCTKSATQMGGFCYECSNYG